jgi:hypothetical protein
LRVLTNTLFLTRVLNFSGIRGHLSPVPISIRYSFASLMTHFCAHGGSHRHFRFFVDKSLHLDSQYVGSYSNLTNDQSGQYWPNTLNPFVPFAWHKIDFSGKSGVTATDYRGNNGILKSRFTGHGVTSILKTLLLSNNANTSRILNRWFCCCHVSHTPINMFQKYFLNVRVYCKHTCQYLTRKAASISHHILI